MNNGKKIPTIKKPVQLQKISDAMSTLTRPILPPNDAMQVKSKLSAALNSQQRWETIIEKTSNLVQCAVNDYITEGIEAIQRTFEIFEKYSYSIFEDLSKTLSESATYLKKLEKTYQIALFEARWFPHAIHDASIVLFDQVTEVMDSTRQGSANRTKQLDKVFFAFYDKKTLDDLKRYWKSKSDILHHNKKIAIQSINAYHRKEYALTISALMTLWEGIIAAKVGKEDDYRISRQTRDNIEALNKANDISDVVTQFCKECIFYDCNSIEQVKEDVPGRHAIVHAWYTKYPSRKTALNAILFTDFFFELNSKETFKEQNNG